MFFKIFDRLSRHAVEREPEGEEGKYKYYISDDTVSGNNRNKNNNTGGTRLCPLCGGKLDGNTLSKYFKLNN